MMEKNLQKNHSNDIKNVIIISIDALRADHLGYMGYNKDISPNIDRLAKEGIVFENALASGSYTFVSFPSFLTSLYPSEYFTRGGNAQTITGICKSSGLNTVSFNGNPHAKGKLDRDFDIFNDLIEYSDFDDPLEKFKRYIVRKIGKKNYFIRQLRKGLTRFSSHIAKPYADAVTMNEKAIGWLKNYKKSPLFFWIHYMDPHYPYYPPDRFVNLSKRDIARLNRLCWSSLSKNKKRDQKNLFSEEDMKNLINLYDGEIKFVDECIGIFIENLKDLDIYKNSIIFLFSDHGEMLGEHGVFSHEPYNLYHPQLHVPLIIEGSNLENYEINHPVTLMDLAPTILDFLGIKNTFYGDYHLINKKREYIISEGFKPQDVLTNSGIDISKVSFSCRWNNWELLFNSLHNKIELHNLDTDLKEENNLMEQEKDIKNSLMAVIERHMLRISKTQDIKKDIRKAIRSIRI